MSHNLKYNKKLIKKFQDEYGKVEYPHYDNYDAIEVPFVEAIPSDYLSVMGVPITFLDKYCPDQFEIVDANTIRTNENVPVKGHGLIKDKEASITLKNNLTKPEDDTQFLTDRQRTTYARIVIRKKV